MRVLIDTCAMVVRGYMYALQEKLKNGAIVCILSIPKYAIINLKIIKFKDYKSTKTNIIQHIIVLFKGAAPLMPYIFKKIKQNEGFLFKMIFFKFMFLLFEGLP